MEPVIVNGKEYQFWGQFINEKRKWIGGILEDFGDSMDKTLGPSKNFITKITDITLLPNGKDSAFFQVIGEKFTCGFDVKNGGILGNQEEGWLNFGSYGGHTWRIKQPDWDNTMKGE